jgi:hypothetical protein
MIDHSINPKRKDNEWIKQYIKGCWDDFSRTNAKGFYNAREEFARIRSYMRGEQDVSFYKKVLIPDDNANDDNTYLNISWAVLPVIPKFRRLILQIIKNLRYRPGVFAVDNLAMDDQEKYYADIAAKLVLIDQLKEAGLDPTELGLIDKSMPQDFDELEMEMSYSYKDNTAKKLEILITDIFEKNRYSEIRDRLIGDIHDLGVAVAQDYVDYDGEIRTRYIDPVNFIAPATDEPDFCDSEYMGEVRWMTLSEISNLSTAAEMKSESYQTLVETLTAGPNRGDEENRMGDRKRVLYIEMRSNNSQTFEVRTKDDGSKVMGKKTGGSKNKEVFDGHFDVVYKGYWVIDTDYFFDCGLETNMKRPEDTLKEVDFSYSVYAPEIRNGVPYSLGKAEIPIADQIQLAYLKVQNAIIKSKPKGIVISADALQSVPFGPEEITPAQNLDLFNTSGSMILRFADEDGHPINQAPIKELVNGLGNEAKEYYEVININIQLLREITGLNEISDGSSPDPKLLKSVAQMAQLSANNSIKYIHDAEKKLTDRVGQSLMIRIMDAAEDGSLEYYVKAVGSNAIKTIKLGSEVYGRKMALYFEEVPTAEDKQELQGQIAIALQPIGEGGLGQITLDDAVMIRGIDNMKQAWQFLAHRVKKNLEKMQEMARARAAENAQYQQQSAITSEEEKRKTLEFEYSLKAKLIELEKGMEYDIESLRVQGKMSEEQEKSRARITEKSIDTESKEFINSTKEVVPS